MRLIYKWYCFIKSLNSYKVRVNMFKILNMAKIFKKIKKFTFENKHMHFKKGMGKNKF